MQVESIVFEESRLKGVTSSRITCWGRYFRTLLDTPSGPGALPALRPRTASWTSTVLDNMGSVAGAQDYVRDATSDVLVTAGPDGSFISWNNSARHCRKCENVSMQSARYSCHIFVKLEFSWQIFEKVSNIKFNQNPPSGRRAVPCGQTDGQEDRHDKANGRFSQFCKRA